MVLGYKEQEVVKNVEKRDMGIRYVNVGGYGEKGDDGGYVEERDSGIRKRRRW